MPRTNPPGPFDNSSQWFINITEAGVIDGVTEAGDAFTEFFTFRLQSTLDATNGPSGTYGIAAGNFHDTHVYMTVVASGTVGAGFAGADIHNLDLTYTSAVFRMFVDGDGTATGEPDVDVQIAEFGGLTDPAGFNVDGVAGVTTLQWDVGWDCALAGVFDITGTDVTAGNGAGGCGAGMTEVNTGGIESIFKITKQAITLEGFTDNGAGFLRAQVESQSLATGTSVISGVPEPMTLGLMGLGLIGIGAAVRRRRAA